MGPELKDGAVLQFRSGCMRVAFLAMDRPEIQYMGKECARVMNKPSAYGLECLKHIIRFLIGESRLVWHFYEQHMYSMIDAYSDTNWAGCPVTRKSTSCSIMMLGKHCIGVNTSTQSVIGLSSTEAEFYGGVKTACRALGVRGLMGDLGVSEMTVRLSFDSSGAKGIAAKRGAGEVRHIELRTLWLQNAVERKLVILRKVPGKVNPADIGTKILTAAEVISCLALMGMKFMIGSAKSQKKVIELEDA